MAYASFPRWMQISLTFSYADLNFTEINAGFPKGSKGIKRRNFDLHGRFFSFNKLTAEFKSKPTQPTFNKILIG